MRRLCLMLGLLPVAAWIAMTALGWEADAQVISGTLASEDPAGSAVRGLAYVGTWLTVAVFSPPLLGGSALWWLATPRTPTEDPG